MCLQFKSRLFGCYIKLDAKNVIMQNRSTLSVEAVSTKIGGFSKAEVPISIDVKGEEKKK